MRRLLIAVAVVAGSVALVVCGAAHAGVPQPDARAFYVVQTGDTFGSIAAKEGISIDELQALNPGVSSNTLQVGQKLRVK